MKRIFPAILAIHVFVGLVFAGQQEKWDTSKSTHFIVYFKEAPEKFVEEVIEKSEKLYDKIADNLGFTRFNFWLWDNRAKIYVYNDANDYRISTGQPAWSEGAARPREKIIYSYPYSEGFFETILPHEMGHIIFREFVGFNNPGVPTWLDEGVASYQQDYKYTMAIAQAKEAAAGGTLIPMEKLSAINPQTIVDPVSAQLYYAEAISIVDYMIKEFGKNDFVLFCQNLRDKRDLQRAVCSVYPFSDLKEFDAAWQRYLKK